MTDSSLMDANCIHGVVWYDCQVCIPTLPENYEQLRLWSEDYHESLTFRPKGNCCICKAKVDTPYETPADPPFYPKNGGWHCQECENWLLGIDHAQAD